MAVPHSMTNIVRVALVDVADVRMSTVEAVQDTQVCRGANTSVEEEKNGKKNQAMSWMTLTQLKIPWLFSEPTPLRCLTLPYHRTRYSRANLRKNRARGTAEARDTPPADVAAAHHSTSHSVVAAPLLFGPGPLFVRRPADLARAVVSALTGCFSAVAAPTRTTTCSPRARLCPHRDGNVLFIYIK